MYFALDIEPPSEIFLGYFFLEESSAQEIVPPMMLKTLTESIFPGGVLPTGKICIGYFSAHFFPAAAPCLIYKGDLWDTGIGPIFNQLTPKFKSKAYSLYKF